MFSLNVLLISCCSWCSRSLNLSQGTPRVRLHVQPPRTMRTPTPPGQETQCWSRLMIFALAGKAAICFRSTDCGEQRKQALLVSDHADARNTAPLRPRPPPVPHLCPVEQIRLVLIELQPLRKPPHVLSLRRRRARDLARHPPTKAAVLSPRTVPPAHSSADRRHLTGSVQQRAILTAQ